MPGANKSASLAREGRACAEGAAQVDGRKGSQVDGESSLGDSASLGDKGGKCDRKSGPKTAGKGRT